MAPTQILAYFVVLLLNSEAIVAIIATDVCLLLLRTHTMKLLIYVTRGHHARPTRLACHLQMCLTTCALADV